MNFIANKDNLELSIMEKNLSVESAFDGTQIDKLTKRMNERDLVKAISYVIIRSCEMFNIKGNVSESQSIIIALDFMDKYKYETLEDIVLMFKYARQGNFGDVFRIDGNLILGNWMPKYLELKSNEREKRVLSKKTENQLKTESVSKDFKNFFSKYLKSSKSDQVSKKTKNYFNSYPHFIKHLPKTCKQLTNDDLIKQIKLAEYKQLYEAVEIYKNEQKIRLNEK